MDGRSQKAGGGFGEGLAIARSPFLRRLHKQRFGFSLTRQGETALRAYSSKRRSR